MKNKDKPEAALIKLDHHKLMAEMGKIDLDRVSKVIGLLNDNINYIIRNLDRLPDEDDADRLNKYVEKMDAVSKQKIQMPSREYMNDVKQYVANLKYLERHNIKRPTVVNKKTKTIKLA